MSSIAISIPAYNNEMTILKIIKESEEILKELTNDYEIIVIDDGSEDATYKLVKDIEDENIKIFHHTKNKGFGETITEVFTLPTKEWVFFIPADGQISPSELKKVYPTYCNYDYILGWRKKRRDNLLRKICSVIYNLLISLIAHRYIHDVNSVALLRRSAMENIKLKSKSAFIHAEMCLKLLKRGFRVKEVIINHNPRLSGRSGAFRFRVILSTLNDLMLYILGKL